MTKLVYYSSRSGNTARFVSALGLPAQGIATAINAMLPSPVAPYVLLCPTFADGEGHGTVPKPVIRFLNDPGRRSLIRGVIAGGNRSFGATFALAGDVIARKCKVPLLYKFELAGTLNDVAIVQRGLALLGDAKSV